MDEKERHFKNALSNFGGISEEEVNEMLCFNCKNFIDGNICKAFPDGTPLEVVSEEFIHDKIHPEQDNEVVFEPKINYDKFIGTGDEIEYVGKIDEVVIVKREEEEDK
jgi:hypothetical protein